MIVALIDYGLDDPLPAVDRSVKSARISRLPSDRCPFALYREWEEVSGMRELAALLFGRALDPDDLCEPEDGYHARVRESGEWCQSAPGPRALRRLAAVAAEKEARDRRHLPFGVIDF
jgi:hypothetical protein